MVPGARRRLAPAWAALIAIGLILARGGGVAGAELAERAADGGSAFVLRNGLVEAVVDPAGGGACRLRLLDAGAAVERPPRLLALDAVEGRTLRYRPAHRFADGAVAALTLTWDDGAGLEVAKTVSLLDGQQVLHVSYRIVNASGRDRRLATSFPCRLTRGEAARLTVRHEQGFGRFTSAGLAASGAQSRENVRWFSVGAPAGAGLAAIADAGLLERVELTAAGRDAVELRGATTAVPADRTLSAELILAPYANLGNITNATARALCAVETAWERPTATFVVTLTPLADLGTGAVGLRLSRGRSPPRLIRADPTTLRVGQSRTFRFPWVPPAAGAFRLELVLPGRERSILLGRCWAGDEGVRFVPGVLRPMRRAAFEQAGPGAAPAGAETPARLQFTGLDGEPVSGVRVDLGLGESETLGVAVAGGDTRTARWDVSISMLTTRRGVQHFPEAAVEFLRGMGPSPGPGPVAGRIAAAPPGEWRSDGLALLRVTAPVIEPASYYGRLEFSGEGGRGVLPVEVAVWPVERPVRGPVALYAGAPVHDLFGPPEGSAYRLLAERGVRNVAVEVRSLIHPSLATVRAGPDGEMALNEWLAAEFARPEPGPLPPIDFRPVNAQVEAALLSGLTDLLAQGRLSIDALAPPGCRAQRRDELTEWYWRELAGHLHSRGMRRLRFAATRPLQPAALDAEWSRAARLLARAGWSPCGPYTPEALADGLLDQLAGMGDVFVAEAADPVALPDLRAALPAHVALGAYLRALPRSMPYHEARDLIGDLTRLGADVVLVGTDHVAAAPVDTLAWEGARDAVDEANYLRMLARYAPAGALEPPMPALSKRQLLERLAEAASEERAPAPDLCWDDLPLVAGRRPRAAIAVDPAAPAQHGQARLLNALVEAECGRALPVVELDRLEEVGDGRLVIVCGAPAASAPLQGLVAGQPDLLWRLERNGWLFAEFTEGGTRFLALLTGTDVDRGRPLISFKMLLRREGPRRIR